MARAIDAEKVLKHFRFWIETNQVKADERKAIETCIKVIEDTPTLTPPNEWVSRVLELDELYTKLQTVTGFTAEQLLEVFKAGYTLEKPDYSKHFEAMENLAESDPPNEPLTLEQLREMDGEPVWVEDVKHWALIDIEKGGQWAGIPFAVWAENGAKFTYDIEGRNLHCYRRPPEGDA